MPWAWHQAMEAWKARDLERRIALPPRPGDEPPGHERVVIEIRAACGITHTLRLLAPTGKARSDQHTVEIDGAVAADLEGATAIGRRVASLLPHYLTKRERHEADRINEDWL